MPKRIAVIDIGSNTVRFVVYDGNSRSPLTFYNEKVTCRLGAGLQDTNRLNPDGVDRALRAMKRFQTLSDAMGVSKIVPVATAAVRAAVDGPEFCTKIKDETGLHVDIVSGEEEARLSALGVISGHPTAKGLICDMGGSSMELAWVKNQTPSNCISTPFAPLSMGSGARAEVNAALAKLRATYPDKVKTLYLVGGSFRALARLDMERRGYPLTIVQDYKMTAEGVEQVSHLLGEEETRIAASDLGISSARYELLPSACQILLAVLDSFAPKKILMSSFGLREGALYAALPAKVQKRDPLISAAEVMAKRSARFPEFGMALYDWLTPLFPDCSPDQDRLMRAACLLHDVNWRAHPDYRAEISFDTAARANLAGLSHSDRIFLGLALMHRYAMRLSSPEYQAVSRFLPDRDNAMAQALGKSMRLGALFSSAGAAGLGGVELTKTESELVLTLSKGAEGFDGERVEQRHASLASDFGLQPVIHS